jgi:ribosomal protein L29
MDYRSIAKIVTNLIDGILTIYVSGAGEVKTNPDEEILRTEVKTEEKPTTNINTNVYCGECLSRHYLKALGLLEEAERFSVSKGYITPEARDRIRMAVKEIVTAEEDFGIVTDKTLEKKLDELKAMQRDIRKWMWQNGLLTSEKDINKLREAIAMVKTLSDRAHQIFEEYMSTCEKCKVRA